MSSEPARVRFTAWLSADELRRIEELAAELDASKNYVVRNFVRAMLGLPVSPWVRERAAAAAERPRAVA